ncbi:hypothetical protein ABZZ04_02635 [Streptomyces sp. NPDC006435]|uniref:hypothetical protein n=1 Tax=Streptomyces sp. NPDC006435 TaxID=3154300 RepID=UPI0033A579B2
MMRQHIKLSAVLVVVVLALTGFSTSSSGGRSGKSKGSSSSSGGGCSNSKKSNGSSSDYDSNDDYDYGDSSSSSSSSGGTDYATPAPTASDEPGVQVIRCAQPRKGKRKAVTTSTVRLTANATGSHTYEVEVEFFNSAGNTIDLGHATVTAEDGETKTVNVRMDSPRKVSQVKGCRGEAELSY